MPGTQLDDPFPANTYAGFAAAAPGRSPEDRAFPDIRPAEGGPGAPQATVRTYALADLQRDVPRRGPGPITAAVALAVTFGLGAGLTFVLLHGFPALALRPAQIQPGPTLEPPGAAEATHSLPAAPLAMAVTAAIPDAVAQEPAHPDPPRAPAARPPSKTSNPARAVGGPRFVALDEELNKAYAEAIRSGAPAGPLSEQQETWIIRRDRVRQDDPDLAEDLYRARIAELQALSAQNAKSPSASR
jgi:uncharacterized protein YecT (DUF1311 family)